MGLTREELDKRSLDKIIKYIETHGEKVGKEIIWNTYPVCVKDICVEAVVVKVLAKTKTLSFGDFVDKKYKSRKTTEGLERKFIDATLEDMIAADKKYKK